ncbi:hypothetical protein [Rhizobium changzhiense]|uniref:hypothetical protein n=1 Tax=Rhizobium changzhiense TaxID=2692317 RepID=UPI001FEE47D9|nr:hypothetical protein [Rhizobium changzhiense]
MASIHVCAARFDLKVFEIERDLHGPLKFSGTRAVTVHFPARFVMLAILSNFLQHSCNI